MTAATEAGPGENSATMRWRPHPIVFLRAGVWLVVAAGLAFAGLATGGLLWLLAASLFLAAALTAAVEAWVARTTTELAVGEGRLQLATGLLRRRSAECFPRGVLGIEVRQGPLGRLLDYGWLRVRGLGEQPTWLAVSAPRKLCERIEALALSAPVERRVGSAPPAAPARLAIVEAAGDARRHSIGEGRAGLIPNAKRDRF